MRKNRKMCLLWHSGRGSDSLRDRQGRNPRLGCDVLCLTLKALSNCEADRDSDTPRIAVHFSGNPLLTQRTRDTVKFCLPWLSEETHFVGFVWQALPRSTT